MENSLFSPFYSSSGICTDTRSIKKDSLFICIKGENFDGNTFATKALENGAKHVIVDNADYYNNENTMTLVENSVQYLQQLANYHRKKFDIPVIGITGSNGKTTSKELINAVLSKKYNVLATEGNLNNHLGVPFTLLRLNENHDIAIVEMGANHFKDIEELCQIAEPNYGIITNIGKAHLEGFGSFEGVLKTKKELYESIEQNNGTIVVNGDDPILMGNLPQNVGTVSYGTTNEFTHGELIALTPFVKMKWKNLDFESEVLETKMVGSYNFYNYLAAAAFGCLFDVPRKDISDAIVSYQPTNKRSQVQKSDHNTLILDCYNANPSSMKSALESFAMMAPKNKLFIIGDMRELGDDSLEEHSKILELIEKLEIKGYTVGEEFGKVKSANVLQHFSDSNEVKSFLEKSPIEDHLIILKGSRGIRLEILEEVL